MELNNHFGVTSYKGEDILFYTQGGTFAANAWIKGDAEYEQVLGQRFEAFTADDGKEWGLLRSRIRRVKDQEELDALWAKACDAFKFVIEVTNIKTSGPAQQMAKYRILDNGLDAIMRMSETNDFNEALEAAKQYIESV